MLSFCPACHAKIDRTKVVLSAMPPLLLELWREQLPKGRSKPTRFRWQAACGKDATGYESPA